jgi:hypothetical protein
LLPLQSLDCRATYGPNACCNVGDGKGQVPTVSTQACEGSKICCGGEDGLGECKAECTASPSSLWDQFVAFLKSLLGVTPTIALIIAIILVIIAVWLLLKAILPGMRGPPGLGGTGYVGGSIAPRSEVVVVYPK